MKNKRDTGNQLLTNMREEENFLLQNEAEEFNTIALKMGMERFQSEASLKSFLKKVMSFVRQSNEYKAWVEFIKDTLKYNSCVLSQETVHDMHIDIHHHPLRLWDIVTIVLNKYSILNAKFSTFDIIDDVLQLHYSNKVGYVCLMGSLHEKFHRGRLDINIDATHGLWRELLEEWGEFIPEEIQERCKELSLIKKSSNYIKIGKGEG